jgi:hypothetical protein
MQEVGHGYAAIAMSTDKQSAIAYAETQSPLRTARARSFTSGLAAPSSDNQAETVLTIPSTDTRAAGARGGDR